MRSDSHTDILPGVHDGAPDGHMRRIAVVYTRWNERLVHEMRDECLAALGECRAAAETHIVPGAYELPLACKALAQTRRYHAVIALGCVIRGETPHFDYVAGEAARGITDAALQTGVPVIFGVLTVNNQEQAEARALKTRDNKGREFALAGLEMANLIHAIKEPAHA